MKNMHNSISRMMWVRRLGPAGIGMISFHMKNTMRQFLITMISHISADRKYPHNHSVLQHHVRVLRQWQYHTKQRMTHIKKDILL